MKLFTLLCLAFSPLSLLAIDCNRPDLAQRAQAIQYQAGEFERTARAERHYAQLIYYSNEVQTVAGGFLQRINAGVSCDVLRQDVATFQNGFAEFARRHAGVQSHHPNFAIADIFRLLEGQVRDLPQAFVVAIAALGDIVITPPEGTHSAGGAICPGGYSLVGGAADCGGGRCFGNQFVCGVTVAASAVSGVGVVTDISITPEGTHYPGGVPCPAGYSAFGSVADCGGGRCLGNQLLCKRVVPASALAPGETVITGFWMTPPGSHVPGGGGCPAGYSAIGGMADCGGAVCVGNQLICVKRDRL